MNATRSVLRTIIKLLLFFQLPVAALSWAEESSPDKFANLSPEQRAFLSSETITKLLPARQLEHEIASRNGESLAEFTTDLMNVAKLMGYDPSRDMGAAPLNLTTDRFHRFVVTPPELRKLERDPGPFSVDRYLHSKSGIPTFGGAPVAIWPEDLVAGEVDVAIVGVPSNMSSGVRDAAWAPHRMRALETIAEPDPQTLLKPFDVLSVVDYGNFGVDPMSIELSTEHVAEMVAEVSKAGTVPMIVGGDTSMLYPGVVGVARENGDASFGLVHFSAHPDAERFGDHTLSDRQAMFRLLEEGVVRGQDLIQIGLRGPDVEDETLQWLRDEGVRYHTIAEIKGRGFERVFKRVLRELERGPDKVFVSVDVSVLAPADMIAAGRTAMHGLSIEEVTRSIRHICAVKEVVGFEMTDLAPMMDLSRLSVMHANALLNACLVGMSVRRSELAPDYTHPLARDHGQR